MAKLKASIAVLGAGGQLGHVLAAYLQETLPGRLYFQARRLTGISFIDQNLTLLDARDKSRLLDWLGTLGPVAVVNCIGCKKKKESDPPDSMEFLNSKLPLLLASHLDSLENGSRLIHISSDGVFSGSKGSYTEEDPPDADDPYGLSKRAGEVVNFPHLTLRTSFVGHSLLSEGLLDWFLKSSQPVSGYRSSYWNGLTTLQLSKFIAFAIKNNISGLAHLGGSRISKYELMKEFAAVYQNSIQVEPVAGEKMDRSLRSVRTDIDFRIPEMKEMLSGYRQWYLTRFKPSA